MIISTAGKDAENNPCKKEYDMARSVLMGELVDDSYFAMIREVEQGDDVSSPACWVKANPILQSETEYSINLLSEIQTEYNRAYGSGDADKIREFLTKRCNIWQQDSEEKFLTSEQLKIWDELAVPQEEFKKLIKGREHLAGYDLSKKLTLLPMPVLVICRMGVLPFGRTDLYPAMLLNSTQKRPRALLCLD